MNRQKRRTGRRHPLATVALLALGLVFTGGAYAAFSTGTAQAEASATSQQTIEEGKKLFQANCATCHGLTAQGTAEGPSLIGVGAAAVDFQVGTGRMPMQMQGPQAPVKPPQFTDEQVKQLAYYVGSLGPGPDIPADSLVNGGGDAEVFSATANGLRVRFDRLDPAPFAIDIGTSENLVLNANGGNERFSATGNLAALIKITVDGGAGNDALLGSNGIDLLRGGDGNDFIDGQQGNDVAFMGAGDDVFQWDPGDGSDTVEGQDGSDTLRFNGSGANEITTFRKITLPLLAPALVSAALLGFALSIDDFVITYFVAGGEQTFPLYVWGIARVATPPQVNVVASAFFLIAIALALGNVVWQYRSARRQQGAAPA